MSLLLCFHPASEEPSLQLCSPGQIPPEDLETYFQPFWEMLRNGAEMEKLTQIPARLGAGATLARSSLNSASLLCWLPHLILEMFLHSLAEVTPTPVVSSLARAPDRPPASCPPTLSPLHLPKSNLSQRGISYTSVRMKVPTSSAQAHVPAFFTKLAGPGRQKTTPTTLGVVIT